MSKAIKHCGVLIIAAGQSKRLGQPKQLLSFQGKSLINRLIGIVKDAGDFPITLVLGANAQQIQAQLTEKNIQVVVNLDWQEGMASSIRAGLENCKALDGAMILVCDQPFINKQSIQQLLTLQQKTLLPIAACYYNNILGTPALFHKTMFSELLALQGDIGAKRIINSKIEQVAKLHFEQGIIDIDTREDYEALLKQQGL